MKLFAPLPSKRRRLSADFLVEPLEDRRLLAGVVTVDVSDDGDVLIRGDNRANEIEITDSSDDLTVYGLNGTQIRLKGGSTSDQMLIPNGSRDVEGDLQIDMQGGDDVVITSGIDVMGDLRVRLGGGNDVLEFSTASTVGDTVAGDVLLESGGGDDELHVRMDDVGGEMRVNLRGKGNEFLADLLFVTGDFELRGSGGRDIARFEGNVSFDSGGRVATGAGNDFVHFFGNIESEAHFTVDLGSSPIKNSPTIQTGAVDHLLVENGMDERDFRDGMTIEGAAGFNTSSGFPSVVSVAN